MKQRRIYSAISYVAATLALSGQLLAAPADVSGGSNLQSTRLNEEKTSRVFYALNEYPVSIPTIDFNSFERISNDSQSDSLYDEGILNRLQQELNTELDAIIELKGF